MGIGRSAVATTRCLPVRAAVYVILAVFCAAVRMNSCSKRYSGVFDGLALMSSGWALAATAATASRTQINVRCDMMTPIGGPTGPRV